VQLRLYTLLVPVIISLTALERNIYDEQENRIVYQIVSFRLTLHACAVKRNSFARICCSSYPVLVTLEENAWRTMSLCKNLHHRCTQFVDVHAICLYQIVFPN
jgi:hypothetical protein